MNSLNDEINYWYFSEKLHLNEDGFGPGYYGYKIIDQVIRPLKNIIPQQGKIVMLGTHRCFSFNLLCEIFGPERCLGFDLYNPTHHPQVIEKDILTLKDVDRFPIAFCYNDISSFPRDAKAKIAAQRWAAPALVKSGVFLGKNNLNRAGYKAEEEMLQMGYANYSFDEFLTKNKLDKFKFTDSVREGHLFSVKQS